MPARAPPSIDMLQTVMRPSIESARMASPAYSMTEPVPPAVPISPMMARMMSLAVTPAGKRAVDLDQHVLGLLLDQRLGRQHMLDLRGADAMGQRAEGAMRRGVAVAADDGGAGQGEALLGADDVDDALALVALVEILDAEIGARSSPAPRPGCGSPPRRCPCERSVVGMLWSTTASVFSGERTLRPVMRRPSKACGLVTSWTRWRSI